MIGAFLGWKLMLLTLMMASLAGTVVGVGLIAAGRASMTYDAAVRQLSRDRRRGWPRPSGRALLDWYLGFF